MTESVLGEHVCRRIGLRQRVGADDFYIGVCKRELDECASGFRSIPAPLEIRRNPIRDLDNAVGINGTLEAGGANNKLALAINNEEAVAPRVGDARTAQSIQPALGHFARRIELAQAGRDWESNQFLEVIARIDHGNEVLRRAFQQIEMSRRERHQSAVARLAIALRRRRKLDESRSFRNVRESSQQLRRRRDELARTEIEPAASRAHDGGSLTTR